MADEKEKPKKLSPTRCDQGEEIIVNLLTVTPEDLVTLRLILCLAPYRVAIHLDNDLLVDEQEAEDEVVVQLDTLSPGLHRLDWSYMTNAEPWKVQSEVLVNGIVRFRQRKGKPGSKIPFQHSFLLLRVR